MTEGLFGWRASIEAVGQQEAWHGWIVATEGWLCVFESLTSPLPQGATACLVVERGGIQETYDGQIVSVKGRHGVIKLSGRCSRKSSERAGRRRSDSLRMVWLTEGRQVDLHVIDAGVGGVGFKSVKALPEADAMFLILQIPDRIVTATGRVAHQKEVAPGTWTGGIRLAFMSRIDQVAWIQCTVRPWRQLKKQASRDEPRRKSDDAA